AVTSTAALACAVDGVDAGDLDVEDLLDRDLDLGLVGVGVHQERVLVLVEERVRLLAHHGGEQYVAVVLIDVRHLSSSSLASMEAFEPASTKPAFSAVFTES